MVAMSVGGVGDEGGGGAGVRPPCSAAAEIAPPFSAAAEEAGQRRAPDIQGAVRAESLL